MLKGECHHILDSLERDRLGIPWKSLTDDNLDPSDIIAGVPMILEEELVVEVGEPEPAEFAILRKGWGELSASDQCSGENQTYPMLC